MCQCTLFSRWSLLKHCMGESLVQPLLINILWLFLSISLSSKPSASSKLIPHWGYPHRVGPIRPHGYFVFAAIRSCWRGICLLVDAGDLNTLERGPFAQLLSVICSLIRPHTSDHGSTFALHVPFSSLGVYHANFDNPVPLYSTAFQNTGRNLGHLSQPNTSTWLDMLLTSKSYSSVLCSACQTKLTKRHTHIRTCLLLCFDLSSLPGPIALSKHAYLPEQCSSIGRSKYRLYGVIYFGDSHFVCRIIDCNGAVWFHGSM
jgi:hypothetical protein